jgi:hypothetical protein
VVEALFLRSTFLVLGVSALISLTFLAGSSYDDVLLSSLCFEVALGLLAAVVDGFLI